ncbi:hypothetical protein D2U14_14905 [Lacticaseibacillus paracasei]|nr:hypothetical protein D2U14_14905 [Lacticaseibacillus paracasei]
MLSDNFASLLIQVINSSNDCLSNRTLVSSFWPLWSIWLIWIDWRSRCLWIRWIHWRQLMLQMNREVLISCVIIVECQICWIAISNQLIPLFLIIRNVATGTITGFRACCS